MTRDPMGFALSMMSRLAANPLLDRLSLRATLEKTAYHGTPTGFRTLAFAGREFRRVNNWLPRKRLPKGNPSGLFDLSLTDDQRMITDLLGRFARDTIRPAAAIVDATGEIPDDISRTAADSVKADPAMGLRASGAVQLLLEPADPAVDHREKITGQVVGGAEIS